ncbi:hypothetical protein AN640_01865 [Candidatus Epulonipiscium fishelsonii]|uniref:Uncharacterized protein n=1 Tax=Candidatus Epulonipiscium fishelsonii TaxID=77094 RepID=A0ACC8XA96_9FIRM|nr:hypothetical protein AN640_01865 [Epulopiscium sp. SCG-D08WGA-EpuloA1]OON96839.1 MAG: hypothetical protein ATN32_06070 [Epulopiscium sp. AS2M-Bin002]
MYLYWSKIIRHGKISATYKFALAEAILEMASDGKKEATLKEIALYYAYHLCFHLKEAPKQCTSQQSQFLEVCKLYNDREIVLDDLINVTVKNGFNDVID